MTKAKAAEPETFPPGFARARKHPAPPGIPRGRGKVRTVYEFGTGKAWAETFPSGYVRSGDRLLPRRIEAHLDGRDGRPSLDLVLEVVAGVPQCREVRIASLPDGLEVRPGDLEAVDLARMVEVLFASFAMTVVDDEEGVVTARRYDTKDEAAAAMAEVQRARAGRYRRTTDATLAEVARLYRENPRAPRVAIAEAFTVSRSRADQLIKQAADEGHLPPTTRGKRRA